jgi:prevent-host-death family protein
MMGGAQVTITIISSRKFNQDAGKAKKAALDGPVFITDRGTPAHVLLSIEEYRKLSRQNESIVDLLAMPPMEGIDVDAIEFEPMRLNSVVRPVDLA